MELVHINLRIDREKEKLLDRISEESGREKGWILREIVSAFFGDPVRDEVVRSYQKLPGVTATHSKQDKRDVKVA